MANPGPSSTTTIHPSNLASNQAIRLLGVATGVSVNATGDQAVIAMFTAPSAAGTAIVANAALSALTGSTVVSQRTVASTATQSGQNLYLNVGTAQGAAATMDVYVYGYDFSTFS
jgi:hypothetical protein